MIRVVSKQEKLLDSNKLKEEIESSSVHLILGNGQVTIEDDETAAHTQQPRQTEFFHSTAKNETSDEPSSLRRSSCVRRPNPKYEKDAIVVDVVTEPTTYDKLVLKKNGLQP